MSNSTVITSITMPHSLLYDTPVLPPSNYWCLRFGHNFEWFTFQMSIIIIITNIITTTDALHSKCAAPRLVGSLLVADHTGELINMPLGMRHGLGKSHILD